MHPWMNHTGEYPPHLQEVDGVLMREPRVIEVRERAIERERERDREREFVCV